MESRFAIISNANLATVEQQIVTKRERYHKDSPRSEVAEKTNEITPEGGEEEEELGITSLRKHQVTSIKPPPAQ